MAVQIAPQPRVMIQLASGAPAAGYLLYTFQPNTVVDQVTYTDSTGQQPNANPIILDQYGSASVYLTPGLAYEFVLASPTDTNPPQNPIWTSNNLLGVADCSLAMQPVLRASTLAAAIAAMGAQPALGGAQAGIRNHIRNGNFCINQRQVSGTVILAAGQYGHDGWKGGAAGCTYSFVTTGIDTLITITAGSLVQVIDGNWIETTAMTLSWTGTAEGRVVGGAYATSPVALTSVAGTNLSVEFGPGTLGLVQAEAGNVASTFERIPLQLHQAIASSYLLAFNSVSANNPIGSVYMVTATSAVLVIPMPVQMRSVPTGVSYSALGHFGISAAAGGFVPTAIAFSEANTRVVTVLLTIAGATAGQGGQAYFSNAAGQLLITGAEL